MKNYSTSIDYHKTVSEIMQILGQAGAKSIQVEYNETEKYPTTLFFHLSVNNRIVPYRLHCNYEGILVLIQRESKLPVKQRNSQQALRVGWRCIKDWVEAQLAFVESEMVMLHQVFLPYAVMNSEGNTNMEVFNKLLLES